MSVFVPDTVQLTKDITISKEKEVEKGPAPAKTDPVAAEVKLMSERFEALLKQLPNGDPVVVRPPGCDQKDVLSSWSYSIPQISGAREVNFIRKVCAEYQIVLNKPLTVPRYLVFLLTAVKYYNFDGEDNSNYKGVISFVLKK